MRQLFITIALAAIMAILAAVGCAAQDNVASAYNKFSQCVDGEFTTMSKVINYRDIDSGEIIGECEVKQFKLPAGKGNYIKNLTRAMAHDSDNAYHSASGKAGNKGVTYAIAYGTGKNDFEASRTSCIATIASVMRLNGDRTRIIATRARFIKSMVRNPMNISREGQ